MKCMAGRHFQVAFFVMGGDLLDTGCLHKLYYVLSC